MTDPKEVNVIKDIIETLSHEKRHAEELEAWAKIFKFDIISNIQNVLATSLDKTIEKLNGLIK